MSGIDEISIKEAYQEADKMLKFFKSFEKLQAVLKTLFLSEQLINERETKVASLENDILQLQKKYEKMSRETTDQIVAARNNADRSIEEFSKLSDLYDKKLNTLHEEYKAKVESMDTEHYETIKIRQVELNKILSEIDNNKKILEATQKRMDELKSKLG